MRDPLKPSRCVLALAAIAFMFCSTGCLATAKGIAYGFSDKGPDHAQEVLLQEELEPYRQRGESAITGRAFLQTPAGELIASGHPVYLTPATDYMMEIAREDVVEKNEMLDRKAEDLWWTTRADQDGRFVFSWLPAGKYIALSEMAWSPGGGTDAQLAIAYGFIEVRERERVEAVVTRKVGDD